MEENILCKSVEELNEEIDILLEEKQALKDLIITLDEMLSIVREHKDIKKNKQCKNNIIKEIIKIYLPIYKTFRNELKYITENFCSDFSEIYNVKLPTFIKYFEQSITYTRNYTCIEILFTDEEIEERQERLMQIEHNIFPDIFPAPENNKVYQKKKLKDQKTREESYRLWDELYNEPLSR